MCKLLLYSSTTCVILELRVSNKLQHYVEYPKKVPKLTDKLGENGPAEKNMNVLESPGSHCCVGKGAWLLFSAPTLINFE